MIRIPVRATHGRGFRASKWVIKIAKKTQVQGRVSTPPLHL